MVRRAAGLHVQQAHVRLHKNGVVPTLGRVALTWRTSSAAATAWSGGGSVSAVAKRVLRTRVSRVNAESAATRVSARGAHQQHGLLGARQWLLREQQKLARRCETPWLPCRGALRRERGRWLRVYLRPTSGRGPASKG